MVEQVAQLGSSLQQHLQLGALGILRGVAHQQRQGAVGRFVQRGGQLQRQPLQVGAHQHLRRFALGGDLHLVSAAALGVPGQLAHHGQRGLACQGLGAGLALGLDAHALLRIGHATTELHRPAQTLAPHPLQRKTAFIKANAPLQLAEQRGVGTQLQLVAAPLQLPLHLAALQRSDGQFQLQL